MVDTSLAGLDGVATVSCTQAKSACDGMTKDTVHC